ncbi:type 4 prepilin peptidase 1 [Desulfobotulus alkaliphilus]|uniref:Prepilin leader peptidase/N-methyltransferase n=1 Tax=Desulfobotulus alkaliphilus TaxID=622671 RepID=A0A562RPZ9_9BACT|nr:A24 family peptidase [Desulfobotulus alkaliphilus]TWI71181.1 type 4 prepilin peptidase 1 [Desulfobotulus alkaliphilus]
MTFFLVSSFIFGAIVGSFLNVCILRIPEGLSIVHPPSRCPGCEKKIAFYDNIPILSWLMLRGKCRNCQIKISPRYPLVEVITACLATALMWRFGLQPVTLIFFLFTAALVVITFIDMDHRIIPDVISLPGIPLGFLASGFFYTGFVDSGIGILVGGGSLLAVALGYRLLTGRDGMGGGDIKLLAMIGAFIGWQGVLFTIFASSLTGTLIGILAMIRQKEGMRLAIPFGPFLAFGALLYLFWGPEIIGLYMQSLGR